MIKKRKPDGGSEDVERVFLQSDTKGRHSVDSDLDSEEDTLATLVQNKKVKSEVSYEVETIDADEEIEAGNYSDADNQDNDTYMDDTGEIETIEYDEEALVEMKPEVGASTAVQYLMPVAADVKAPMKRLRTVNPQEAKHKCDLCGKCFKKPYLLRTHKSYHQNNR